MQIEIRLNGETKSVPEGTSVVTLVAGLGLRPEVVAVERNGRIVRRAEHAATALQPGDELELVTLVGGG